MTAAKRIFVNVAATYGRSLVQMALGLFSSRWIVLSLGEVDYGLYGLIGGLSMFVAFINNVLASAVGRFYAVAVGESSVDAERDIGCNVCKEWFNAALLIHTVIPIVLMSIGYPLGRVIITSFLEIPDERLCACMQVWGWTCLICLVSMCSVPYVAMFTAKQNIAEMTIFSLINVVLNFILAYVMISFPSDNWLVRFAAYRCVIHFLYYFALCIRARFVYQECRLDIQHIWDSAKLKQIISFAGYRMFAETTNMIGSQGVAIATNKFWGPVGNAAMTVGRSVSSHTSTLCSALGGAFWPAIANLAGKGDLQEMREYSYRACKIGAMLFLIFAIPVALESEKVMIMWLKSPPSSSASLCIAFLVGVYLDQLTSGLWMVIYAVGDIKQYQIVTSLSSIFGLIAAIFAFYAGYKVSAVFSFCIVQGVCCVFARLFFSKKVAMISVCKWLRSVLLPTCLILVVCTCVGIIPVKCIDASYSRIVITASVTTVTFVPAAWFLVLTTSEKKFLGDILRRKFALFGK